MNTIYIASDHRGFITKEKIIDHLAQNSDYQVIDLGPTTYQPDDDYPDFAFLLAEKVVSDQSLGILICGSGIGMSISANKVTGARAGLCLSPKQAVLARRDDFINILCLSSDLVSLSENLSIIDSFLSTPFDNSEKYFRRINKITHYESQNS